MTCEEKLIKDHPEWTEEEIVEFMKDHCPASCGILGDPDYCTGDYDFNTCSKCWNREIPETEETNKKENTEMNACEFTCEEKAKLIEEIKTLTDDVERRSKENQELRNKLAERSQQIENQADLIRRKDAVINDYRTKLRSLNQTNEDLANKLAAERAKVERLEGMVRLRDEEIDKLVKETDDLMNAIEAKYEEIKNLRAEKDAMAAEKARALAENIAITKELAEKLNSCGNECALHPTDIARTIARHMRNKYDALIYVGFSHDDAMSLIPMWTD